MKCPNDCSLCRDVITNELDCVYETPHETCKNCGKKIFENQIYDYRGIEGCEYCIDKLTIKVENARQRVIHNNNHTVRDDITLEEELKIT
jgi:DNA-directed RNA polymerase subunit RPC12/RpoP